MESIVGRRKTLRFVNASQGPDPLPHHGTFQLGPLGNARPAEPLTIASTDRAFVGFDRSAVRFQATPGHDGWLFPRT